MGRRGLTVGWITLGVIATSILAGCGGLPVWDQFDKIEVGRPLPAELPEGMERTHLGASLIAISKVEKEPPPDFAAGFRRGGVTRERCRGTSAGFRPCTA